MRNIDLYLAGAGLVGSALLGQMQRRQDALEREYGIRVRLMGLANSRRMLIGGGPLDISGWRESLAEGEPSDFGAFVDRMIATAPKSACFCDCTASEMPSARYLDILGSSIAVVTPNKRANAGSLERYRALVKLSRDKGDIYRYETTVGAALPVIGPIADLVATGDRIVKIEAVLSGTLAYVFSGMDEGRPFSRLVAEAREKGYTEPDPRDDLRAADAIRKTVILAREAGFSISAEDVAVEPLLPPDLMKVSGTEEFMASLSMADEAFEERRKAAASRGALLRYVSVVTRQSASVSVREFASGSPFGSLAGTENMVAVTSDRYREKPLVVRGAGAGAELTAGGVFADILKTAR